MEKEQASPCSTCKYALRGNSFVNPRLLKDREEVTGTLGDIERVARDLLAVKISSRNVLLPIKLKAKLEKLRGQEMAVTFIDGKHYLRHCRQMPPSAPLEKDLPQARVAELEAENERLRSGGRAE